MPETTMTPRQAVEATCRKMAADAEEIDMKAALLDPHWLPGEAPHTEWMEKAILGPYELMVLKTDMMLHSQHGPEGAVRISWSLAHDDEPAPITGGPATTKEEAKEFAYLAYQAVNGYHTISGRD